MHTGTASTLTSKLMIDVRPTLVQCGGTADLKAELALVAAWAHEATVVGVVRPVRRVLHVHNVRVPGCLSCAWMSVLCLDVCVVPGCLCCA